MAVRFPQSGGTYAKKVLSVEVAFLVGWVVWFASIVAAVLARDPDLVRYRGRSPLVLVPVANPENAASLVSLAGTLAAPGVGRIMVLSVVRPPEQWDGKQPPASLTDAQNVVGESLHASFHGHLAPETLVTISDQPWEEIARVSRSRHCETLPSRA